MDLGESGVRLDGVIVKTDDSTSMMTDPARTPCPRARPAVNARFSICATPAGSAFLRGINCTGSFSATATSIAPPAIALAISWNAMLAEMQAAVTV